MTDKVATPQQARLWFLDRLYPGAGLFSVPVVVRLRGPLSEAAIIQTVMRLVARHEALRTTLRQAGDRLLQHVNSPEVTVPTLDLTGHADSDAALAEFIARQQRVAFNLERGPLFCGWLLKLGNHDHALVIHAHHVCLDRASIQILLRECAAYYQQEQAGRSAPPLDPLLARPAPRVADVLPGTGDTAASAAQARAWWRGRLADRLPSDMATVWPRPARPTLGATELQVDISSDLIAVLHDVCRATRCTPFITLAGILAVLISRQSMQRDQVTLAVPRTLRQSSAAEHTVGLLLEVFPLPVDIDPSATFTQLLRAVRATVVGALSHDRVPYDELLAVAKGPRGLGGTPLAQVAFQYLPAEPMSWQVGDLHAEWTPAGRRAIEFDLAWDVAEAADGGLRLCIDYATDLFDHATIAELARAYLALASQLLADPDAPLRNARHHTAADRARLLAAGQGPPAAGDPATVLNLFETVVSRRGDAVAVVDGARQVTYEQLAARAGVVAADLRVAGAGTGRVVAVDAAGADFLVAILGVLRSGNAYLSLPPSQPLALSRPLLSYLGQGVVVCDRSAATRWGDEYRVVIVDDQPLSPAASGDGPAADAVRACAPGDLCYVMTTSGTLGRPKPVGVTHQGVVSLIRGLRFMEVRPDDVILQLAPRWFDASTFEIWCTLLAGARLVMTPSGDFDPATLAELARRHSISVLHLTAGLHRLVADERPDCFDGLRLLLTGGDVVSPAKVAATLDGRPGLTVGACYGPTEATTFTSAARLDNGTRGHVPLGQPLPGRSLHIFDENLEPCGPGVTGEIYVGGDGLAWGYLGMPGPTAAAFIADPHAAEPGARLYRTGDLARRHRDGQVEFMGRLDTQVKIRGHRVELAAVEKALLEHPDVADSQVVAYGSAGDRTLLGFVLPRAARRPTPAELRRFLADRLPYAAVPSAFGVLDRWLMTPNGKLDRAALGPELVETGTSAAGHDELTELERIIAREWTSVLGTPWPGSTANFFEVGGQSLAAARLAGQLERALGVPVPMRMIFDNPTVSLLAETLTMAAERPGPAGAAARPPGDAHPPDSERPTSRREVAPGRTGRDGPQRDAALASQAELDALAGLLSGSPASSPGGAARAGD